MPAEITDGLPPLVARSFFARDPTRVARELVGQLLVRHHDDGRVVVRVTETEAYLGLGDTASHARHGRTPRNAAIWGAPGGVYIYRCYGIHLLLNLVAGEEGRGAAALVRSAEIIEGHDLVRARRRAAEGPALLAGPGNLAQGLALDLGFNFMDVCLPGLLEVRVGVATDVVEGPRVGIDYANARDRKAPLRFGLAGSRAITRPTLLRRARQERRAATQPKKCCDADGTDGTDGTDSADGR